MTKFVRVLLIVVEDLVGIALLGIAGAMLVGTVWPSPETTAPADTFGYVFFAVAAVASVMLFIAANNLHRTKQLSPRLHLAAAFSACLLPILAACNPTEPRLETFTWSRDSMPPQNFSQFDEALSDGDAITVWTNTYGRQDMSKARGWIETTPSRVLLCFSAPDAPASAAADTAKAYPTLLTYALAGPNYTSDTSFGGDCSG